MVSPSPVLQQEVLSTALLVVLLLLDTMLYVTQGYRQHGSTGITPPHALEDVTHAAMEMHNGIRKQVGAH